MTDRLSAVLERLPDARLEVAYNSPLELLVTLLLAVQGTEARAASVAATLLTDFQDVAELARADVSELADAIGALPLANRKAATLKRVAELLIEQHRGSVPDRYETLLTLPGVGPKTAGVVAGELGDFTRFPIERHAERVLARLGFQPDDVERRTPAAQRYATALRLTSHGRNCCTARQPGCARCELATICPSGEA